MSPNAKRNAAANLSVLESPEHTPAGVAGPVSEEIGPPRHRKIARLPKPLRDLVNSMLDDNAPAREIIHALEQSIDPKLPYPVSEMNISRWKETGYRRYLAQQERLATVAANREAAHEIITSDDTTTLPEATLQIIASQYYEFLGDFSPESLKQKLGEDPLKYTRFLNVFARLVREIVHLRKYRDDAAKTAAAELKKLDPKRDFSDRENEIVTDRMDDFFKKPRRKSRSDSPSSSFSSPSSRPKRTEGGLVARNPAPAGEGGLVARNPAPAGEGGLVAPNPAPAGEGGSSNSESASHQSTH
jgi:hypothetical protein